MAVFNNGCKGQSGGQQDIKLYNKLIYCIL